MRYCSMCGKEVLDQAVICPHCGCQIKELVTTVKSNSATVSSNDEISAGWFFLGFFIPLAGFIGGLAISGRSPKKASGALLGALFGFILNVIVLIAIVA